MKLAKVKMMEVDMRRFRWLLLSLALVFFTAGCNILPFLTSIPRNFPRASETPAAEVSPPFVIPTATLISISDLPAVEIEGERIEGDSTTSPLPYTDFTLQEGSPFYLSNFNHPQAGCKWMGLAGQVFDGDGDEVLGLTIVMGDDENPASGPMVGITGSALAYGLGGYEIQFSDGVIESQNRFWVQVYNSDGTPLTNPVYFNTYGDCEHNLTLINFVAFENSGHSKSPTVPTQTLAPYP